MSVETPEGRTGAAALHCGLATAREESACFALRAREYARFYRNIPAGRFADDLDELTLPDGRRASQTLAVRSGSRLVGTCRVVRGRDPRWPGLRSELATLTSMSWPDIARRAGVPAETLVAAELSKFAVARDGPARRIKWMMLAAAGELAAGHGAHVVLALMPPMVERAARDAGVRFRPVTGCRLRRDGEERPRFLLRYRDYFLPSLRRRRPELTPEWLESADPEALRAVIDGVDDGPRLWWIRPGEMADTPDPESRQSEDRP